jgi:phosphoglycolate phosphatase-like HAD superfamily hydrolase
MRYDLVVLDLDVLGRRDLETSTDEALQELTDHGATLGLVSRIPDAAARAVLGLAQQHFDAIEGGETPDGTAAKVLRIMRHLEFTADRALLVTANGDDVATVARFGISSALLGSGHLHDPPTASLPAHVIAELSDVVDIISGRPILRIVR